MARGRPRYVNPVPGQPLGRTDQGVDIAAPPGTPVYAITDETLEGILPNWFRGQPFYYFRQNNGVYNYVAEQFRSNLRVGQRVRAGQKIGEVASSGTGLELGFAESQATAASGHPTPTYTEGQATVLGKRYRQEVFTRGSVTSRPRGRRNTPADWLRQAGWPSNLIPIMVAIGGAESGWNVAATHKNDNGTEDDGWLQINSIHGYDRARLRKDPVYTARAGLDVYKKQGLAAWTTYTSGAYKGFLGKTPTTSPGRVRPGGEPDTGGGGGDGNGSSDVDTEMVAFWDHLSIPNPLELFKDAGKAIHTGTDFLKWVAWIFHPLNVLRVVEFWAGFNLIVMGFVAIIMAWRGASAEDAMNLIPQARTAKAAKSARASSATRSTRNPAPSRETTRKDLQTRPQLRVA